MPKESFNLTPEEQASIDEHVGHEEGFLQKQSQKTEKLWERMGENQREALRYSDLSFFTKEEDKDGVKTLVLLGIKGTIKGHEVILQGYRSGLHWMSQGVSKVDDKPINYKEAERLLHKYYSVAEFQEARNQQPDQEGDAIAATL
jgi:hypothetical protein